MLLEALVNAAIIWFFGGLGLADLASSCAIYRALSFPALVCFKLIAPKLSRSGKDPSLFCLSSSAFMALNKSFFSQTCRFPNVESMRFSRPLTVYSFSSNTLPPRRRDARYEKAVNILSFSNIAKSPFCVQERVSKYRKTKASIVPQLALAYLVPVVFQLFFRHGILIVRDYRFE